MNVLLDTHIVLWCLYEPEKLSDRARTIISDSNNWISYSQISLWECEIKHNKHPNIFTFGAHDVYEDCFKAGFSRLELQTRHIIALSRVGEPQGIKHNNPFDRILMAQAYADNMMFLTHDKRLENYDLGNIIFV